MIPPKFNVQKVMFIGYEAQFYLKHEVDDYIKENMDWFKQRELFDANREVYVQEYRKCQAECKRLRALTQDAPSVGPAPSVDSMIIEENN